MDIRNKHLFITGSAKRVGSQLAAYFSQFFTKLTLHYHTSDKGILETQMKCQQNGAKTTLVQANLANPKELHTAATSSTSLLGKVDVLINCASIFYPTELKTIQNNDWTQFLDINLLGQFNLIKELFIDTPRTTPACILNIGDIYAVKPFKHYLPYSTSKGALLQLTRSLAKELSPQIRVNLVSPGSVLFPEGYSQDKKELIESKIPLKRAGNPLDIAHACHFLIENDYMTGVNLIVDGGRSLT